MNGKVGQMIAEAAHEAIGYDVLVTDGHGSVIASSDLRRVGSMHEPSIQALSTGLPVDTTKDEATAQKVRPGYTSPITVGGTTVGTISIAGPPQKVRRYGMLVRKQAEIMLQEQALIEIDMRREQAVRDLAEAIVEGDGSPESAEATSLRAAALGFASEKWRAAALVEIGATRTGGTAGSIAKRLHALLGKNFLVSAMPDSTVIIFMPLKKNERPLSICEKIVSDLDASGTLYRIGVGPASENPTDIPRSARLARAALDAGSSAHIGEKIFDASDLRLEILLHSLPRKSKREYCESVLKKIEEADRHGELVASFTAWFENGFSLSQTAQILSVHRNTLQYRLKRIKESSGLDPWHSRDAFTLWAALLLKTTTRGM